MPNIFYHFDALGWNPGFFCSYQAVVGFLDFIEQQSEPIGYKVFLEKGLYFDINVGHNWWEYFFEPIEKGNPSDFDMIDHPSDTLKSRWNTNAISIISRERASFLINKYIKVKPIIQNKIDNFVKDNFDNFAHQIIGIHYRGTDKSSEAPRVPYSVVASKVEESLTDTNAIIFIATDEQNFVNYMKKRFGKGIKFTDAQRSLDDGTPLHHIRGKENYKRNRYLLGEEAVIDCYLLSKCNLLIRTHSNLSSSAANINPNLPVIDLNRDIRCRDFTIR